MAYIIATYGGYEIWHAGKLHAFVRNHLIAIRIRDDLNGGKA